MTVGRGACAELGNTETARRIKQWCVEASMLLDPTENNRRGHMALHRRPISADEVLGDALLLNLRRDLWDGAEAVVDV